MALHDAPKTSPQVAPKSPQVQQSPVVTPKAPQSPAVTQKAPEPTPLEISVEDQLLDEVEKSLMEDD